MTCRVLVLVAVATLGCLASATPALADVTVSGVAFSIDDAGKYSGLGNVKIQAYRDGAPLLTRPKVSRSDGSFDFSIPNGAPFDVLFYGGTNVPELTQLAGRPDTKNQINVVLLSAKQYKESKKAQGFSLPKKVESIVNQLPNDDELTLAMKAAFGLH